MRVGGWVSLRGSHMWCNFDQPPSILKYRSRHVYNHGLKRETSIKKKDRYKGEQTWGKMTNKHPWHLPISFTTHEVHHIVLKGLLELQSHHYELELSQWTPSTSENILNTYALKARNITHELCPPKPNEFDKATSTACFMGSVPAHTRSSSTPSSGLSMLIVGCSRPEKTCMKHTPSHNSACIWSIVSQVNEGSRIQIAEP